MNAAVRSVLEYEMRPWQRIIHEVCAKYQVGRRELMSPSRARRLIAPRFEAAYRLRTEITVHGKPMSYPAIARRLGRSDHTTARNAVFKHMARMG